jgi:hypothetical protein
MFPDIFNRVLITARCNIIVFGNQRMEAQMKLALATIISRLDLAPQIRDHLSPPAQRQIQI